ncbi:multiple sugar transport system permease protein [Hydrogenispora ethanolica]|uniref:Multiple sugar transport system permease protein n=1 Tax=Hydrogenispora ethanolica TaxID=1082276 RepID=A0A4R1RH14_HYDET|nr:sugar ABC transporter permease [Hydrogenispora ethanolica]TCL65324.1 multiple sugar transport system permease protein [Hydrogenispora ethanolica]
MQNIDEVFREKPGVWAQTKRKSPWKEYLTGYLFAAPYIIGAIVFFLIPACISLYYCFMDYNLINPAMHWNNFDNFLRAFREREFGHALFNNVYYAALYVPLLTAVSLFLAILLNKSVRFFRGKFLTGLRGIYFFPSIAPWFVVASVWLWLLNADIGPVNLLLAGLGLEKIPWLDRNSGFQIPALVLVNVWKATGYMMFIFLIGLQNIPQELYESADIDGVNWWQKHRHITLPMLSPTTFFVIIYATLWGFQNFDQTYVMVFDRFSPGQQDISLPVYLYTQGFKFYKMGYASVVAWTLFLVAGGVTLIQNKLQKRWVHY